MIHQNELHDHYYSSSVVASVTEILNGKTLQITRMYPKVSGLNQ